MSIYGNPVMLGSSGGGSSIIVPKTITANGVYNASADNADGYDPVTVNVGGGGSTIVPKTITANGVYNASADSADGYNPVTVSVPMPASISNSRFAGPTSVREGWIGMFESRSTFWQPQNSNNTSLDVDWSQKFTLHLKFKFTQLDSRSEALYGCSASGTYYKVPLTCECQTGGWWFGFSTNGTSWNVQTSITLSDVPRAANTVYTLTVQYENQVIAVTLSDGTNTKTNTINLSAAPYHSSSYYLAFGGCAQNSNLFARYCLFDPSDTYIESNGTLVWGHKAA